MEWIILFVVSWALFIVLVDLKKLKYNIWSGLFAALMQQTIDSQKMSHGFYSLENLILSINGSSIFFTLGPVLVVGTLFAQYYPDRSWARITAVVILAGLFSMQEHFLVLRKDVIYLNWYFYDSITYNILSMITLSWFSIVILNKRGCK